MAQMYKMYCNSDMKISARPLLLWKHSEKLQSFGDFSSSKVESCVQSKKSAKVEQK